jgi:hypothetical protein
MHWHTGALSLSLSLFLLLLSPRSTCHCFHSDRRLIASAPTSALTPVVSPLSNAYTPIQTHRHTESKPPNKAALKRAKREALGRLSKRHKLFPAKPRARARALPCHPPRELETHHVCNGPPDPSSATRSNKGKGKGRKRKQRGGATERKRFRVRREQPGQPASGFCCCAT